MKASQTLKTARRSLTGNKVRTFLMMLGVMIGIAALTIIMAVGQGAKAQVMERVGQMFGSDPITVLPSEGERFQRGSQVDVHTSTLTPDDARAIAEEIPNVSQVCMVQRKSPVPMSYRDQHTSAQVFGATPNFRELRMWDVESGEFLSETDEANSARVCLVGQTVARELFGDDYPVGETIRIENVNFRVKGVLEGKGASPMGGDFDNRVIIPLSTFSRRLYNVTNLSQVIIEISEVRRMDETVEQVTALLRERHNIVPPRQDDFQIRTPDVVVSFASEASRTMSVFLGVVAAISLLVGGLVVMNIMLVSVGERTREIGIRRAVGATRKDIMRQFLVEALAVTILGGVLGVAIGFGGAKVLTALKDMPTLISWQIVALALVFSIVVGLIFGVQPAKRAAQLDPAESLRT